MKKEIEWLREKDLREKVMWEREWEWVWEIEREGGREWERVSGT